MLSLEGVPAFYIHSLFGTKNDYGLYRQTNHNRALSRGSIKISDMNLNKKFSTESYIFNELKRLLQIRKKQPAFHPNAVQFHATFGEESFWNMETKA